MNLPFFCFFFIVFIHLRRRLSISLDASFDRVEARMLLCSSATAAAAVHHTRRCTSTSTQQQFPHFLLNRNRPFICRLFNPFSEATQHSSSTSVKDITFINDLRSTTTTPNLPAAILPSKTEKYSLVTLLNKNGVGPLVSSEETFADLIKRSSGRPSLAYFSSTIPREVFSNIDQMLLSIPSIRPSHRKCNSLMYSSSPYLFTRSDLSIIGDSSTICHPIPRLPSPSIFLPRCPPAIIHSTKKNSFAIASSTKGLLLKPVNKKFFRTSASTIGTTLFIPPIPSTRRPFNKFIFTVKHLKYASTYAVSSAPLLSCIHTRHLHLPSRQHLFMKCCSKITTLCFLPSLPFPHSPYRGDSSRVPVFDWKLQLHAPLRYVKPQTFPRPMQHRALLIESSFGKTRVLNKNEKYYGELTRVVQEGRSCNGLLYAVPLISGITRSDSPSNADIPQFLLPPLFTAVETADHHHAQSILAFWKKPGVPRVGWTDDMLEAVHAQQLHVTRDRGSHPFLDLARDEKTAELHDESKEQTISTDNVPLTNASRSAPSYSTPSSTVSGLKDQGEALLIMTGTSPMHLDTLGEAIVEALWEKHKREAVGRDGRGFSGWVALAFMDLEVHIMTPVTRERYALEELYSLCPRIDISDAIKIDKLHGFEFMSGGIERFEPGGPPFDPELDADYRFYE